MYIFVVFLFYRAIMDVIQQVHGLTGCDTVATYFGVGKQTALNVLRNAESPFALDAVGNLTSTMDEVNRQATKFIVTCYGLSHCDSMTETRQSAWANKV
jgi:hypothetical protein